MVDHGPVSTDYNVAGYVVTPAAAEQLAAWIGEMFDMCADPQRRLQLTVIDSDEVRAAKGYRETRARAQADRERSLTTILCRGRADGSFPLTEPDIDAFAQMHFA